MIQSNIPPEKAELGDLWYNDVNQLIYYRSEFNRWIATDVDGDIVDIIHIDDEPDFISDYDRAMGIL